MPTKPETILKKIESLPDHQSKLCLQFKEWLEYENDNSERNWINNAICNNSNSEIIIPMDEGPRSMELNPTTNKIYVTGKHNVFVIDVNTETQSNKIEFNTENTFRGLAVNPTTNRIYVSESTVDIISVIDGATDTIIDTIDVGPTLINGSPSNMVVNSLTNTVYATIDRTKIIVIDGSTNTVSDTIPVGNLIGVIAVNPVTDKIYVTYDRTKISVINGETKIIEDTVDLASLGFFPTPNLGSGLALNSITNMIYIVDNNQLGVFVLDGDTNNIIDVIPAGSGLGAIEIDEINNRIFVPRSQGDTLSIIDGNTNSFLKIIRVGVTAGNIVYDPDNDKMYTGEINNNIVTVRTP